MGQVRNKTIRTRRGSIYVVTMSTGLIVAVLATTALMTARVQRLERLDAHAFRQAQVYAESALEMAQYRMNTSPTWRSQLANNAWSADQAMGDGSYNFVGSDPLDNDLIDSNYDPVSIVATGRKGNSLHKMKGTIEVTQPGMDCLGSGVHAHEDLSVDGATLKSFVAPCSSNKKMKVENNGKLYANCEAKDNVTVSSPAQVFGTILQNQAVKSMPDKNNILDYYFTNGTTISLDSLPLWDREYLTNGGAENGVTDWTGYNCTITQNSSLKKNGSYSLFVNGRNILPLAFPSFIYQNVTSQIAGGVVYALECWIYVPGLLSQDNFRIRLQINATGGNVGYVTTWMPSGHDTWTKLTGSGNITWSGTLQSAYWYVESQLLAAPYYLDDASMKEANAEADTRVIHRALLSPQTNSLTGITNSQGIYVINCSGKAVNIRDSRCSGTLVLRDPKDTSRIEGSTHCEAAVSTSAAPDAPNLLTIVTDKKIKISLSAALLDERLANRNFNPVGTPYQSASDADVSDSYPSQISGIVYSGDDLIFGGNTTINGVVVSDKKISVQGTDPLTTSLTVHHNSLYRYINPPVDFRDAPVCSLKSGSVSRVVD